MKPLLFPWKASWQSTRRHWRQTQLSCGQLGWEPRTPRDASLGQRCDCDKSGFAQNWFGRAEPWRSGRKGMWGYLCMGCSWLRAAMFGQGSLLDGALGTQGHAHSLALSLSDASRFSLQNNPLWGWAEGQMGEAESAWLGGSIGGMSWGQNPKFGSLQLQHLSSMCKCWTGTRQGFFFKAQSWFVQFNDFLRHLFSYLFPLSKGSWLFNIF